MFLYRPEKNHELQLTSFFEFRAKFPVESKGVKLVLLGGCRNVDDEQRVYKLKELAHELGIGVWRTYYGIRETQSS